MVGATVMTLVLIVEVIVVVVAVPVSRAVSVVSYCLNELNIIVTFIKLLCLKIIEVILMKWHTLCCFKYKILMATWIDYHNLFCETFWHLHLCHKRNHSLAYPQAIVLKETQLCIWDCFFIIHIFHFSKLLKNTSYLFHYHNLHIQ